MLNHSFEYNPYLSAHHYNFHFYGFSASSSSSPLSSLLLFQACRFPIQYVLGATLITHPNNNAQQRTDLSGMMRSSSHWEPETKLLNPQMKQGRRGLRLVESIESLLFLWKRKRQSKKKSKRVSVGRWTQEYRESSHFYIIRNVG